MTDSSLHGGRLVLEQPCEHDVTWAHVVVATLVAGYRTDDPDLVERCVGGKRIIIDPSDLPEKLWRVLNAAAAFGHPGGSMALWNDIMAGLSALGED